MKNKNKDKDKDKDEDENVIADIFDKENLEVMSGKKIKSVKEMEDPQTSYVSLSKEEFIELGIPFLGEPKKTNVFEWEDSYPDLTESTFRMCIGKALCAETDDPSEDFRAGNTNLIILTQHPPKEFCKIYGINIVYPWKYISRHFSIETQIFVQDKMDGEMLRLLQNLIEVLERKEKTKIRFDDPPLIVETY